MPRALRVAAVLLMVVFLATAVLLIRHSHAPGPDRPAPDPQATAAPAQRDLSNLAIPDFSLVDHQGRSVNREILLGRYTVLDVIFTNCPLACPMMTEKMHALTEALADLPDVGFVSIAIDPKRDTPERLREYRRLHDIQTDRWSMLTDPAGDDREARRIVIDGLKGALDDDPSIPITAHDGSKMNNIRHPTWFFLVGPDARVIDIYASSVDDEMRRLEADARRLATSKR